MSINIKFLFLVLLLLTGASVVNASTNYYVSNSTANSGVIGSDSNNGTSFSTPFLTVQKAISNAGNGSIIFVNSGTYVESSSQKPGTLYLLGTGWTVQTYTGLSDVTIQGTNGLAYSTTGEVYSTSVAASNVAFKNIAFIQRPANIGSIFDINGPGLNGLTLTNCTLTVDGSASNKNAIQDFPANGVTSNCNVNLQGCTINQTNGTYDEYFISGHPYSPTAPQMSGLTVNNCSIKLQGGWSAGTYGWNNVTVTNSSSIATDVYGFILGIDGTTTGYPDTNVLIANNYFQSTNGHACIIGAGCNGSTGSGCVVENNRVVQQNSSASLGQGLVIKESTSVLVLNNDISIKISATNGGLYIKGSNYCILEYNNVVSASGGSLKVYAGDTGDQCANNTVKFNRFVASSSSAYSVLWQLNAGVKPDTGTSIFDYNDYDQRVGGTATLINQNGATNGISTIPGFQKAGYGYSDTYSVLSSGASLFTYNPGVSGKLVYALIENSLGQVWNGSTFEPYTVADFTEYPQILGEDLPGTGVYDRRIPTNLPNGTYTFAAYLQSGLVPSPTDGIAYLQVVNVAAAGPTISFGNPTPAANANGWNNTAVTMPYTPSDSTSGVAFAAPGSPLTFASQGANQTQAVTATDNALNTATVASPAVSIDETPPTTTASGATAGATYTSSVTITLSATDSLSGVASTYYTLDGVPQQTYTAPFVVSSAGSHTITYWSVDNAGNVEIPHTMNNTLDLVLPRTSASLSGTQGSNNWYTSAVQVSLTVVGGTLPVTTTCYTVDGGGQQTYTSAFMVSGDRIHTVTYCSVDSAGNTESAHTLTIMIDGTAPSLSFGTPSPAPNANGWNNSAVTLPYTTSDATSGVASSAPGSPLTFSSQGVSQTQAVTVADNAGNMTTGTSPAVNIDETPPVTTASGAMTGATYTSGVTITLSGTDNSSGVASTYYTVDGAAQQTYSAPFGVSGGGVHTVTYWSADNAGNIESARPLSFTLLVPTTISVSPASVTLLAGGTQTFAVTVQDQYGNAMTPSSVSWIVSPAGGTITSSGSYTASANPGTYTITATAVTSGVTLMGTAQAVIVTAPTISSLLINPSTVTAPSSATGTVTLNSPAPTGGIIVSLGSTHNIYASPPSTVMVPSGSTSASFTIQTANTTSTPESAVLTATYNKTSQTATITINPQQVVMSLTLNPSTVTAPATSTGTVTLNSSAPAGGIVVSLASTHNIYASPPSTVTVPAGSMSATFTIQTSNTTSSPATAVLTATYNKLSQTATITVNPQLSVSSLTINPSTVTAPATSTGMVTLNAPAPSGGISVSLGSTHNSYAAPPSSVTVPAGSISTTFTIQTSNSTSSAQSATLTASTNGVSQTATITVNP